VHRRVITDLIEDAVRESRTRLAALTRQSLAGVREAGRPVVALSPARQVGIEGLQRFLFANVYRHPRVMRVVAAAEAVVRDLFGRYMAEPDAMPASWRVAAEASRSEVERAAVVADFVAGMTDRFAIKEHQRLFDATPELR
jgi:dGTPase